MWNFHFQNENFSNSLKQPNFIRILNLFLLECLENFNNCYKGGGITWHHRLFAPSSYTVTGYYIPLILPTHVWIATS